jgi:membrane protein implicated in regulation of membrane protease activity
MQMTALVTAYWLCFAIGLIYVIAAGALGAIGHAGGGQGGDAHAEAGGGDMHAEAGAGQMESTDLDSGDIDTDLDAGDLDSGGMEGLDAGHEMDLGHGAGGQAAVLAHAHGGHAAEHGHGGMMEYNPFSPLSLMAFICAFGASGLIATALGFSTLISLLLAVGGGLVMALVMWLLIGKLLFAMQGTSEAHQADMIGLEAEVLTPMDDAHTGEIAYILDGVRYTAPAKLTHEGAAAKQSKVRIRRIRDNVVFVEEKRKLLN